MTTTNQQLIDEIVAHLAAVNGQDWEPEYLANFDSYRQLVAQVGDENEACELIDDAIGFEAYR